ncbi:hypothetical protein D1007_16334 [Hordeum vulgare]|nr:hypothetical protein D1007_16334 [Hordeum vulgare]
MAYHKKETSPAAGQVLLVAVAAAAVLLLAQDAGRADARLILYDAMRADEVPERTELTRPGSVANHYSRGCEISQRCRG